MTGLTPGGGLIGNIVMRWPILLIAVPTTLVPLYATDVIELDKEGYVYKVITPIVETIMTLPPGIKIKG